MNSSMFTQSSNVVSTAISLLLRTLTNAWSFLPNLVVGSILLFIGIWLAILTSSIVYKLLQLFKIERHLQKYGVPEISYKFRWETIIAEITRWFFIIFFLILATTLWNLPQIAAVLNIFLLYLTNVFVAVIISIVGLVLARLTYALTIASTRKFSVELARGIATIAKWAVYIFVLLTVLNQLGVSPDIIRILFTGLVAMVALAGGLAFGFGGRETAGKITEFFFSKLKQE